MTPIVLFLPYHLEPCSEAPFRIIGVGPEFLDLVLQEQDLYARQLFVYSVSQDDLLVHCGDRQTMDLEQFGGKQWNWSGQSKRHYRFKTKNPGPNPKDVLNEFHNEAHLREHYYPIYNKLYSMVWSRLEAFERCLFVIGTTYQPKEKSGPDVCIGANEWHTPDWLREQAIEAFKANGFIASINDPKSGTWVPPELFKDQRVQSLRLAVRQDLFIDRRTGRFTRGFKDLRERLKTAIGAIYEGWMESRDNLGLEKIQIQKIHR